LWNEIDSSKEKGGEEGCSSAFMSKVWLRKAGNSPHDDCIQNYRALSSRAQDDEEASRVIKENLRMMASMKIITSRETRSG